MRTSAVECCAKREESPATRASTPATACRTSLSNTTSLTSPKRGQKGIGLASRCLLDLLCASTPIPLLFLLASSTCRPPRRVPTHGRARLPPRLVPTSPLTGPCLYQSMTVVPRFYGNRISISHAGSSHCHVLETRPFGQQPQCGQFALERSCQYAQDQASVLG